MIKTTRCVINHWLRSPIDKKFPLIFSSILILLVLISSISPTNRKRVVLRKKYICVSEARKRAAVQKSCSLGEHPVFSAPVWWFHIRIHNRQSLKYYRLSETSWKIHKNIARLPFDACWVFLTGKLPILSLTHLPPYFPTRWRKIHAKTRALLLRIGEVNCDWSLTADVTEIFLSFRFRRRFFSAGETKTEKTGCSRRLKHSLQIIVYITFLFLVKRHWLNCSD